MAKKTTKLSQKEIKHIAHLSYLGLKARELVRFGNQLSSILDFVNILTEVDTTDVLPTSQVTDLENVFREDEISPSLSQKEVLANAPDKYKGYFKVKPILKIQER